MRVGTRAPAGMSKQASFQSPLPMGEGEGEGRRSYVMPRIHTLTPALSQGDSRLHGSSKFLLDAVVVTAFERRLPRRWGKPGCPTVVGLEEATVRRHQPGDFSAHRFQADDLQIRRAVAPSVRQVRLRPGSATVVRPQTAHRSRSRATCPAWVADPTRNPYRESGKSTALIGDVVGRTCCQLAPRSVLLARNEI